MIIGEKIQNVCDFLGQIPVGFEPGRYYISVAHKQLADKMQMPYEEYDGTLTIKFRTYFQGIKLKYYEDLNSELESADIEADFLVITAGGTLAFYKALDGKLETFGKDDIKISITINNAIFYYKLFNFFKSSVFCDYYNGANDEIVIYSSVNGIIKVSYDVRPNFPSNEDISQKVVDLISLATPLEISPFFKNSLFAISKGSGRIKFTDVINDSADILEITKRDYELVSKKFDFEKFRDSLYKEKEKYFGNIREIINKIFSQAVGIPISISATVFATYKVGDDVFMLVLVFLAFSLYAGFYLRLQWTYRTDVAEIEADFKRDFDIISSKSGLSQDLILVEKSKIGHRIKSAKTITFWLIALVSFLILLVFLYIGYEVVTNKAIQLMKSL